MKQIFKYGMSLCAMLLLAAACHKEEPVDPSQGGGNPEEGNFVILLEPASKTINNGLSTLWADGDKVNVFHAVAGTTDYVDDGAFEFTSGNQFTGVLAEQLQAGTNYDWYVSYPYNEKMTSPKKMSISIPTEQRQSEDGSTAHLCGSLCPLAGKKAGVPAATSPTVGMKHLMTVMKIKVTNYEADPCLLETVSFSHLLRDGGRTILTGDYSVDFTGEQVLYAPEVPAEPNVNIGAWEENKELVTKSGDADIRPHVLLENPKTLNLNESATVYLACLPYTIENATILSIGMNKIDGGIDQAIYGKSPVCKAGAINGVKQGSRLAPPFKSGINFYHGKKNADGTYSIDNDGWWRCDLPAGFDLQGSFNFKDLFTTVNDDNKFELIDKGNQNRTVQSMYDQFKSCINESMGSGAWNGNEDLDVNLYFPEDDRSGVFINATAGYNVGAWPILYRETQTEAPAPPYDTTSDKYDSYQGLVMCGYQGWHGTPGDGCVHNPVEGWPHYANVAMHPFIFEPGVLRNGIDFWPDVTEYPQTYKATGFVAPDGSTPRVYSSYDASTVDVHFRWMQEYGIDGVFMQRFVSQLTDPTAIQHSNKVLESAMNSSNVYARAISIMYDMVGMDANTSADVIINDARELIAKYNLMDRDHGQRYYLYHNGKPLVGLVSVGQKSVAYTIAQAQSIVNGLQELGFSVMLGVPAYWRTPGSGDCVSGTAITALIKDVDIIMPWFVGAYDYDGTVTTTPEGSFNDFWTERIEDTKTWYGSTTKGDYSQAESYGVEYCPLVFAGFSDRNIHPGNSVYKRYDGEFYWQQIYKHLNKGAKMLYVAMFDEIDEGTAIHKCLRQSEVPSNESDKTYYVVYENGAYRRSDTKVSVSGSDSWCKTPSELNVTFQGIEDNRPSDYYLWLTGQASLMLKGEKALTQQKPE